MSLRQTDQITDQYGRIWLLYRDERPDRYIREMHCATPTDIKAEVIAYKKDEHTDDRVVHVSVFWDAYTVTFTAMKSTYRGILYEFAQEISTNLEHQVPPGYFTGTER